jgi:protease-4
VVTVAGEIVDGKAGPGRAGGTRIARLIDEAASNEAKALVLRVDSPGGSVLASEQIRSALERFKRGGRPVVVSMANMAASGGYWVSTPASRIFAEPGTVTGSIGIFAVIPSFEKTLAQVGINSDGVRTTPLSGQPDILAGFTPEAEAMVQAGIEHGYAQFVGLVARSRGKSPEQVEAIAEGRAWDGGTARQNGLVDQFGGLPDALAYAASQAKLEKWHAEYYGVEYGSYGGLLKLLLGGDEEDSTQGHDLVALIGQRQQDALTRALAGLGRLGEVRGAQAYCLECEVAAPAPHRVSAPGWLGSLAALLR